MLGKVGKSFFDAVNAVVHSQKVKHTNATKLLLKLDKV